MAGPNLHPATMMRLPSRMVKAPFQPDRFDRSWTSIAIRSVNCASTTTESALDSSCVTPTTRLRKSSIAEAAESCEKTLMELGIGFAGKADAFRGRKSA